MVRMVFKDNPTNSSFQYDFLLPMAAHLSNPKTFQNDNNWNNFNYETFLLLKPNTNTAKLDKKITDILRIAKKDEKTGKIEDSISLETEPIAAIHTDGIQRAGDTPRGDARTTYIFLALAFVILFTACINYVNLAHCKSQFKSQRSKRKENHWCRIFAIIYSIHGGVGINVFAGFRNSFIVEL